MREPPTLVLTWKFWGPNTFPLKRNWEGEFCLETVGSFRSEAFSCLVGGVWDRWAEPARGWSEFVTSFNLKKKKKKKKRVWNSRCELGAVSWELSLEAKERDSFCFKSREVSLAIARRRSLIPDGYFCAEKKSSLFWRFSKETKGKDIKMRFHQGIDSRIDVRVEVEKNQSPNQPFSSGLGL